MPSSLAARPMPVATARPMDSRKSGRAPRSTSFSSTAWQPCRTRLTIHAWTAALFRIISQCRPLWPGSLAEPSMHLPMPRAVGLGILLMAIPSLANAEPKPEDLAGRAKAVLAQLDGKIVLAGLEEPVEVLRDAWGIPHIYAQNQHDLFFAQGFVAAQDRLFQLDLWRRIGRGDTAEIFGEEAIEADRFARLVRYRAD